MSVVTVGAVVEKLVVIVLGGPASGPASLPNPPATMIMDGLDTLPVQHHHHHHTSAFLLTESAAAAAAHHFNVLSFDTCLYKGIGSGGSPVPGSAATSDQATELTDTAASEPQSGDLNTPVTTSGDIPSFFGPSTVVEPPPITGKAQQLAPRPRVLSPRCRLYTQTTNAVSVSS